MRVDLSVGVDQPKLTEAVVIVCLANGRSFKRRVCGARGYPSCPPTTEELHRKFRACAERAVSPVVVDEALDFLRDMEHRPRMTGLMELLVQTDPLPV